MIGILNSFLGALFALLATYVTQSLILKKEKRKKIIEEKLIGSREYFLELFQLLPTEIDEYKKKSKSIYGSRYHYNMIILYSNNTKLKKYVYLFFSQHFLNDANNKNNDIGYIMCLIYMILREFNDDSAKITEKEVIFLNPFLTETSILDNNILSNIDKIEEDIKKI